MGRTEAERGGVGYQKGFWDEVFNDVVSILLASSVIGTQSEEPSPWSVLVNVLFYFVSALVCGILGGLVIAWSVRQVHLEPHFQVLWILVIAYSVYVGTEAFLSTSSIFTIFVCALVCNHYTARTLTKEAHSYLAVTLELISYSCEAFSSIYIGMTSVRYWLEDLKSIPLIVPRCIFCCSSAVTS